MMWRSGNPQLRVNIMALWARARPQPPNDTSQTLEGWVTTLSSAVVNNTERELITGSSGDIIPLQTWDLVLCPSSERCSLKTRCPVWELMHCEVGRAVCSLSAVASRELRMEKSAAQSYVKINHSLPWESPVLLHCTYSHLTSPIEKI